MTRQVDFFIGLTIADLNHDEMCDRDDRAIIVAFRSETLSNTSEYFVTKLEHSNTLWCRCIPGNRSVSVDQRQSEDGAE